MASRDLPDLRDDQIRALLDSLDVVQPATITCRELSAEYHSIYVLESPDRTIFLRAAGPHIPALKTENEGAVMKWVRSHTTIPVPNIVAHDATTENPIGCEYTLLDQVPGVCVDTIYRELSTERKIGLVKQLASFIVQLHRQPFNHMGGLSIDPTGKIVPGPCIEVRSWHVPQIRLAWGAAETFESLNATGPFECWTDYSIAKLQKCQHILSSHESLRTIRETLGNKVDELVEAIREEADQINDCSYVMSHKDLHFSNIMCDPKSGKIQGILDWEFSQVAPLPSWNPGNFLLDVTLGESMRTEQATMMKHFSAECRAIGLSALTEVRKTDLQEAMEDAVESLMALVRYVPLGQHTEFVDEWLQDLDEALEEFEV